MGSKRRAGAYRADAGMTLVEVMVACALLALLAVLFLTMFGAGANQMNEGSRISAGAAAGVAAVERSIAEGTAATVESGEVSGDAAASISFKLNGVAVSQDAVCYTYTDADGLRIVGFDVHTEAAP